MTINATNITMRIGVGGVLVHEPLNSILFGSFEEVSLYAINAGDRDDNTYLWSQYPYGVIYGDTTDEDGVASLVTTDSVDGAQSLQIDMDHGAAYLQWYAYTYPDWLFTSEVVEDDLGLGPWVADYYNRVEFYVKVPSRLSADLPELFNMSIGTYIRSTTGDRTNAESGGDHYYHRYNIPYTGAWHKVVWDMHPSHRRDRSGGEEQDNQEYPTSETGHNYFDALTRFYVDFEAGALSGLLSDNSTWLFDGFKLYREANTENEEQVYSVSGVYASSDTNLIVSWNRNKDENSINHEVRYAFSDIHSLGWANASVPASNVVTPPGFQGYNGMWYETDTINVGSNTSIFVAIKPQNSSLFKQIEIPIS